MASCVSLHPQVRWYQTSTSLSITLKLRDPQNQRCDFHTDRTVYRFVRTASPQLVPYAFHSEFGDHWSLLARALFTGGSGYMFSKAYFV